MAEGGEDISMDVVSSRSSTVIMGIIQEYPAIYNRSCGDFKDRDKKSRAWSEVAKRANVELSTAMSIYQSTRTAFGKYLKKLKKPSGSGAGEPRKQEFEQLRWLEPYIKHRQTTSNMKPMEIADDSDDQEDDKVSDVSPIDSSMERESTNTTDGDVIGNTTDVDVCDISRPVTVAKKPKTNKRPLAKKDAEKELFKTLDQVSKSLVTESQHRSEGSGSTDDEDRNYCLSLVTRLRRLDDKMKAHARFQIEKIFHDIQYSDGTSSTPNSAAIFSHGSTNMYSPYYGVMERPFPQ